MGAKAIKNSGFSFRTMPVSLTAKNQTNKTKQNKTKKYIYDLFTRLKKYVSLTLKNHLAESCVTHASGNADSLYMALRQLHESNADITNLFNPELSHNNIMYTAVHVVPRVNFIVPRDKKKRRLRL